MFTFRRKKLNDADYIKISTREEAEKYQEENYGDYCRQYYDKKELMSDYKYRIPELEYYMEAYAGTMFAQINDYLRNDRNDRIVLNAMIDKINEFIILAPPIKENIIVYRGVSNRTMKSIMRSISRNEGIYVESAFMSTSLRLETVLEEFSYENILKIYVPKGAHAVGLDGINDRNEEEMLFAQKQRLFFRKRKRLKKYNGVKRRMYEFELFCINY